MSPSFTIRLPADLLEAMRRHKEINWSQVIRDFLYEYIKRLEEMNRMEMSKEILNKLLGLGVKPDDLTPYDYKKEIMIYNRMAEKKWKRLSYMT